MSASQTFSSVAVADPVAVVGSLAGFLVVGAAVACALVALATRVRSRQAVGVDRAPAALWIASAFSLGFGAVGATMFVRSIVFFEFGSPKMLVAGWSALFVGAWFLWRRRRPRPAPTEGAAPDRRSRPLRAVEPLLFLIILFNLGCSAWLAMDKPLWQYDALTRWGFKARAFTHDRSVVPYFEDLERGVTQPHYPPLVPLGMTWIHLGLGREDDRLAKALFAATFAALLLGLYGLLRLRTSSTIALGGVALLAMTPCFAYLDSPPGVGAHAALADVPLALITLLSVGLLWEGCRRPRPGFLLMSFVLAGLAPWIKQEGAILLAVNPVVVLALGGSLGGVKRRSLAALGLLGLALLVMAPWYLYQRGVPITDDVYLPMDFSAAAIKESARRLPTIAMTFAREALRTDLWGLLWPISLLALVLAPRRAWRCGAAGLGLVMLLHLAVYAAVYALEDFHGVGAYEQKMAVSLTRLFMHLAPIAVLAAGWQAEALLSGARDSTSTAANVGLAPDALAD